MKRVHFLLVVIILLILSVNLYLYFDTYRQQIEFQKNFLINQTQICSYEIETTVDNFQNELNYILFSENISQFFTQPEVAQNATKKFELIYTKYQDLVVNILLYDNRRNVFSLFRDSKKDILTDNFISHVQKDIKPRELVESIDGSEYCFLPVFSDNMVVGNVQVGLDYQRFITSIFEKYHVENIQWQWLIDEEGRLVLNNVAKKELVVPQLNDITGNLSEGFMGSMQHTVLIDGVEENVITVYIPTRILNKEYGIAFSLQTDYIRSTIIKNSIIIALITLLLIGFILFIFFFILRKRKAEEHKLKEAEEMLKETIDSLPVGVIIRDSDKGIRMINRSARELFGIPSGNDNSVMAVAETVLDYGKPASQDFPASPLDPNQLIHYEKEGNELVIYRKRISLKQTGEDNALEAFIDITPFEKARRQEAAANQAKSDFLTRMSHEIRTPLHAIIGMTEAFEDKKASPEQQEYIRSIRKSADLLLSLIDDLMDLSKIEAGKILLEEIPFRLREEMNILVNLYKPQALRKGIELTLSIDDLVPDELIGDPFRLRQVVSNLVDNSVKFTHSGEIRLTVELVENKAGNITLRFMVEDTGIGIPQERIPEIFSAVNRPVVTSGKDYQGTGLGTAIAKQLVEMMNGNIWVESPGTLSTRAENPGSRFCFTIKVYSNTKLSKKVDSQSVQKYHQIKTLIIQDKNQNNDTLLKMLQGFGVSTYVNFYQENTLELLKNNAGQNLEKYKLIIISDSATFDGFKVAARINEEGLANEYLILLISANDKRGNYIRARRCGVDNYIIEPYPSSELFNFIQDHFPFITVEPGSTAETTVLEKDIAILVADDNLINQKVAQAIFKNLGFEVDIAKNGKEVMELVKTRKYDIIFMDVMMPEMDGMEAADEIRKLGMKMPIIAVTADTNQESRIRSQSTSMNDYVAKPVKGDEIKRILIQYFTRTRN